MEFNSSKIKPAKLFFGIFFLNAGNKKNCLQFYKGKAVKPL